MLALSLWNKMNVSFVVDRWNEISIHKKPDEGQKTTL